MTRKEVRQKWSEWLRSGKFKQAQGSLAVKRVVPSPLRKVGPEDVGYCCLGVLCEIAVEANVIPPGAVGINGFLYYQNTDTYLPERVIEFAGLRDKEGSFTDTLGREDLLSLPNVIVRDVSLARLNDSGFTFEQIADIIDAAPKGLFEEEK